MEGQIHIKRFVENNESNITDADYLNFDFHGECTLEGVGPETFFKLLLAPFEHDRNYLRINFFIP